jgi:leucyl-tRNA synthetase
MFVAPPEKEVEWSDAGLEGSWRFLARIWRFVDQWCDEIKKAPSASSVPSSSFDAGERQLRRKTHETIRRVTIDVEQRIHLNTAISALMELVNDLYAFGETIQAHHERVESLTSLREAIEALIVMMSPFAPHTAEELWEMTGHREGIARTVWPSFDEAVARAEEIIVPVQVNGKLRSRLTVPADTPESELRERALLDPAVRQHTDGKTIRTVVIAKGKLINVVAA